MSLKYNYFHQLPMLSPVLNAHPSPDTVTVITIAYFFTVGSTIFFQCQRVVSFLIDFFPLGERDPYGHHSFWEVPRQQQCHWVHLRSRLLLRLLHKMFLLYKAVYTNAVWQSTFKTFAQSNPSCKYDLQKDAQKNTKWSMVSILMCWNRGRLFPPEL